jgi:hypothetical protein
MYTIHIISQPSCTRRGFLLKQRFSFLAKKLNLPVVLGLTAVFKI